MVSVGRVTRPQGNRGQVMVMPDTDFGEDRFRPGATVFVNRPEGVSALRIAESREQRGQWVLRFEGSDSIDSAETFRGDELRVPLEALRPLDPGAFYVHELLDCEVRTMNGAPVGRVTRVDLAVGVPMLAVTGPTGEVLVPLVDAICRRIGVAARQIDIDPPEGLIDLNEKKARLRREDGGEDGVRS
jgi:16S rRNA processing protein RimM